MGVRLSIYSTIFSISLLSVMGCGVYETKHASLPIDLSAITASTSGTNAGISYAQVNQGVFQPSCISCHGASRPSAGISLDTYAHVKAALDIVKSVAITQQSMPPNGPLQADQITLLNTWIDQGAPEVGAVILDPSPTPAPVVVVPVATPYPTPIATPYQTPVVIPVATPSATPAATPSASPSEPRPHHRRRFHFPHWFNW